MVARDGVSRHSDIIFHIIPGTYSLHKPVLLQLVVFAGRWLGISISTWKTQSTPTLSSLTSISNRLGSYRMNKHLFYILLYGYIFCTSFCITLVPDDIWDLGCQSALSGLPFSGEAFGTAIGWCHLTRFCFCV